MATIEHHFHSEGYEVSPSPGRAERLLGGDTKQIHLGQLGYVMSAQNPIRVAEETAILDHMCQGRFFVGFARGYQDRWTNVIGQHLETRATHSDGTADDQTNRDLFAENVEIVPKAWTQDSIEHKSRLWEIPYPHEEGIDWWMSRSTRRLGAKGEIGVDGRVHRVSVVPEPYQKPHPPVFVPSLGSPASADYGSRQGFVHVIGGGSGAGGRAALRVGREGSGTRSGAGREPGGRALPADRTTLSRRASSSARSSRITGTVVRPARRAATSRWWPAMTRRSARRASTGSTTPNVAIERVRAASSASAMRRGLPGSGCRSAIGSCSTMSGEAAVAPSVVFCTLDLATRN